MNVLSPSFFHPSTVFLPQYGHFSALLGIGLLHFTQFIAILLSFWHFQGNAFLLRLIPP
jgi:hypothetical protein